MFKLYYRNSKFLKLIIAILLLLLLLYTNFEDWSIDFRRKLYSIQYFLPSKRPESLLILIWNSNKLKSWNSYPESSHTDPTCSRLCDFTDDEALSDEADAIALFAVSISEADSQLPPANRNLDYGQLRVFWLTEAPPFLNPTEKKYVRFPNEGSYNWTMTYRRDSDVYLAYSYITPLSKPIMDSSMNNTMTSLPHQFLKEKTRLVAWIASHCHTDSKREEFVSKLSQFIQIDVYGDCGDLKCSTGNSRIAGGGWKKCYRELGTKYKFYLSLENALCFDYVTEKFFYPLESGMVPIVYGGANYSLYGPPGSFINVQDFNTVKELAEYIKFLDRSEVEYLKYFVWRQTHGIGRKERLCSLCERMWDHSIVKTVVSQGSLKRERRIDPNYSKIYHNISSWWNYQSLGGEGLKSVCVPAINFTLK